MSPTAPASVELSVLIPCHNDANRIEPEVKKWIRALKDVTSFEVLVINDGSLDGSARILDGLRRHHPELRVIHQLHTGSAQAIRRGYELARGTYALEAPMEGGFEPEHLWSLWEKRPYYQILVAAKEAKPSVWFWVRWKKWALHHWFKLLFGHSISLEATPYRLCRVSHVLPVLKKLPRPFDSVGVGAALLYQRNHPEAVRYVTIPMVDAPFLNLPRRHLLLALEMTQLWWTAIFRKASLKEITLEITHKIRFIIGEKRESKI